MIRLLGQTWRSVLAVVIAYVLVVALFFYGDTYLANAIRASAGFREFLKGVVGSDVVLGPRGEILFTMALSDAAVFMTLLILFVRVVVITIAVWIGQIIVTALFGRVEDDHA